MTKAEIIEYLYDNNVRADITIEQMAEDLADRKTEPTTEDCSTVEDEPQTEMTTDQIVNELLSIKQILADGKMPTDCAWGKDS